MLAALIMAGGAGTRFWPLSTEKRPKQFLRLFGERTLLQQSFDRLAGLVPSERTLILTNERFVPLVREQLPEVPQENVIGEPLRRDTAAAVALGALLCRRRFGNPTLAVLTADQLVEPVEAFQKTLLSAARAAEASGGALYTFGIRPAFPATGYGYLQRGQALFEEMGIAHHRLLRFREKPDRPTAEAYLASGDYYWNSGMFVWTTEAILAQLGQHLPEHLRHLAPAVEQQGTPMGPEALRRAFELLTSISIDFGVMEKVTDVRCVSSSFRWSDVGGWLALEEFLERDASGNVHRGRLKALSAEENLVFCEERDEVVALIGVKDLIVVRAGGRTLVVHRDHAEKIKQLVGDLEIELR